MLFVRFIMLLLLPVRLPFILIGRLIRLSRGGKAAQAAVAGGLSKTSAQSDGFRQRTAVLWKVFPHEPNDEQVIRPDQQDLASSWADKALAYYSLQLELFPKRDFYEEAERDYFIAEVAAIETGDGRREDQFVRRLREAREIANDNARMLYCELAPLLLVLILVWHSVTLLVDPFHLFAVSGESLTLQAQLQETAAAISVGAAALGVAILLLTAIYWFSYANVQMQNAQELNSFIQTEFTCLNQSFNVARSECMQAEARVDRNQHENVEPYAKAWAGAYHWIAIRQLSEELTIRNNMFQIRRNTWLYKVLGLLLCLLIGVAAAAVATWAAGMLRSPIAPLVVLIHLLVATLGFVLVSYGLVMRRAFEMIRDRLPKDEWSRLYKLRVGEAIAEQVGRDKKNIVLHRDRSAG